MVSGSKINLVVIVLVLVCTLPWIFHKLLCHVGSQSLVLEERAPHLYIYILSIYIVHIYIIYDAPALY